MSVVSCCVLTSWPILAAVSTLDGCDPTNPHVDRDLHREVDSVAGLLLPGVAGIHKGRGNSFGDVAAGDRVDVCRCGAALCFVCRGDFDGRVFADCAAGGGVGGAVEFCVCAVGDDVFYDVVLHCAVVSFGVAGEFVSAGMANGAGHGRCDVRDYWAVDFALGNHSFGTVVWDFCRGAEGGVDGTVSMGAASDVFEVGIYLRGRGALEFFRGLLPSYRDSRGASLVSGAPGGIATCST